MLALVLVSSLFSAFAHGTPLARTFHRRELLESAPSGFTLNGSASPDHVLNLRLALVQSNPQGLEDALYDVSTPGSPKFRQYLTKAEAAQYVAPAADSVNAVNSWLSENGFSATPMTPAGDWLSVQMPVSKANELFNTEFQVYTHKETGMNSIRTLEYSIPAELSGHLDIVHPTVTFPTPSLIKPRVHNAQERAIVRRDSNSCNETAITPDCLRSQYVFTHNASFTANYLGVTGYQDQWPQQSDLSTFLKQFRPDVSSSTNYTVVSLDGGSDPQGPDEAGTEANLDIQYTVGLATGVPVEFISVGDSAADGLDGWLDTINYLLNHDSPPQTVTTSYGANEKQVSRSLAMNYCNAAAQLGTRGVSMIFASGDGGVSGAQNSECTTFVPVFPATCPYITSVGATTKFQPEVAANLSSGGFSNIFPVPSYQSSQVKSYIDGLNGTYDGLYNKTGRGFPDVSAQGTHFQIVQYGKTELVSGTSCSSPTFASVIATLNDKLLSSGKNTLGFLNPWLYTSPSTMNAMTDITSGSNPGCGTNGFSAGTGWDPVTGLGTPNYFQLSAAAGEY